jgi:plastocyanin
MPRTTSIHAFRWVASRCVPAMLLCATTIAGAAPLAIRIEKRDGKPLAGAVLTLEPEAQRLPAVAPVHSTVDQVDLTFVPDVVVIPVGSTVSFPNSDAVSHQVYSFSSTRRFQLPLYRGKPYPPVSFDQPGIVTLGCNIHDNMLAYVVVTNAPFFGRSDARGQWALPDVPNGKYKLRLWHPLLNEPAVEREIEVGSAAPADALVKLTHALRRAPISSRPHSWDY